MANASPAAPAAQDRKSRSRLLWYPFLFAVYPVLELLAHNIGDAHPEAGLRPLLVAILTAGALMGALRLLTRAWPRAAFVSAAWIILFAAYGHVHYYLEDKAPQLAQTPILAGASLLLAAAALFAATRPNVRLEAWAAPLNAAALALVVIPVGQIALYQFEVHAAPAETVEPPIEEAAPSYPDIYYIILDSYTRADTLKAAYGFDNSQFISDLEQTGFNVAECAMSNYVRTELSLASSLNMTYLTSELDPRINPKSLARSPLWNLIRDSAVMAYARERGYRTVAFATGFPWSEWDHADAFFAPDPLEGTMTEFESLLLDTTAFSALEDEELVDLQDVQFGRYRERTQLALETLPSLPEMDLGGPKFVFAHLIIPHPPFVFAEDGSPADALSFLNEKEQYPADKYAKGYVMQLQFINREMTRIVKEIIARSKTPPVIILQGDHGPWLQPRDRRLTILNAYYLPGHADAVFETITPVNTFRLVFDLYMGGEFGLLPNRSYFSAVPYHYDFQLIPNRCKPR